MRSFLILFIISSVVNGFTPSAFIRRTLPLRAAGNEIDAPIVSSDSEMDNLSLEEEIDLMTEKEIKKTKVS